MPDSENMGVRIVNRIALSPAELAETLGISERTLRELRPPLPRLRAGRRWLYPVRAVERELERRATKEIENATEIERELERTLLARARK